MDNSHQPTIHLSLSAMMVDFGIGGTEAQLLYDALDDYAETLLKHIAWEHKNDHHEDAATFFHSYREVSNMKRQLFVQACAGSVAGYETTGKMMAIDKEKGLEKFVAEYKKIFGV